jgi:hypothetical protein
MAAMKSQECDWKNNSRDLNSLYFFKEKCIDSKEM